MDWLHNLFPTLFAGKRTAYVPQPLAPNEDRFVYQRDFHHTAGKHIQQFTNTTSRTLEVSIELYCDTYYLEPGDEMTIIYEQDPNWPGLGLSTNVFDGGLQIYIHEFESAIVMVNNKLVEPWGVPADAGKQP